MFIIKKSNLLKSAAFYIILFLLLLVLIFFQCSKTEHTVQLKPSSNLNSRIWDFPSINGNRFPIVANRVVKYYRDSVTKKISVPSISILFDYLSKVKAAGFNLVTVNLTPYNNSLTFEDKYYFNFFEALRKVNDISSKGLMCIIYDSRLKQKSPAELFPFFKKYYDRDEVYGFVYDEPREKEFSHLKQWLNFWYSSNPKDKLTEKLFYVNLFGIKAEKDYKNYVYTWVNEAGPQVLSFDHYPLWDDVKAKEYGQELNSDWINDYFLNFEFIRETSLKTGIPFLNWVLVHKHWSDYSKLFYRRASKEDIRFQVFSALAYGSKGIFYYNFWNSGDNINKGWHEEKAILDYNFQKTKLYPEIKKVNEQISKIGDTLLTLTSIGVYHKDSNYYNDNLITNKSKRTQLEKSFDKSSAVFERKYGVKLLDWNNTNKLSSLQLNNKFIYNIDNSASLVGLFKGKNNISYFLLVNKNRKNNEYFNVTIDLTKLGKRKVYYLREIPSDTIVAKKTEEARFLKFSTKIDAGSGKLFSIE